MLCSYVIETVEESDRLAEAGVPIAVLEDLLGDDDLESAVPECRVIDWDGVMAVD
jgi:hypothetical protein